jgi:hypothetical protein
VFTQNAAKQMALTTKARKTLPRTFMEKGLN